MFEEQNTVFAQKGQALRLRMTWQQEDEQSQPLDLTGVTVKIPDAHPTAIKAFATVIVNAADGAVELSCTTEQANLLKDGRTNWFRVELVFPDGSNRVTPRIWVNVR